MNLFHHVTVLFVSEDEKRLFIEAGVEFTRTTTTLRGEIVMFEIGENDPSYERVAALLQSLGPKRVRDFSMTVPTLSEYIEQIVRPSAERLKQQGYFAKQAKWERGREVMQQSLELSKQVRRTKPLAFWMLLSKKRFGRVRVNGFQFSVIKLPLLPIRWETVSVK